MICFFACSTGSVLDPRKNTETRFNCAPHQAPAAAAPRLFGSSLAANYGGEALISAKFSTRRLAIVKQQKVFCKSGRPASCWSSISFNSTPRLPYAAIWPHSGSGWSSYSVWLSYFPIRFLFCLVLPLLKPYLASNVSMLTNPN